MKRRLAILAGTGIGYYLLAWLSYAFVTRPSTIVAVWLPSGLLLATLLLLPRTSWNWALVGGFLGNLAADVHGGSTVRAALAADAANIIESLTAAWLMLRVVNSRARIALGTLREVGALFIGAALVSNAFTALFGALAESKGKYTEFWGHWFTWWTGDGMGMLMLAPAILTVTELVRTRARISPRIAAEAAAMLLAVGVLAQFVLGDVSSSSAMIAGPAYVVFPLVIWIAIRFGPWGAATATLLLCGVTMWNASHIVGLFGNAGASAARQSFDIYSYLAFASLSSLVPAAILSERRNAEAGLRESDLRFRQMAEHVKEVFFIIDLAEGRALYTSPMWTEIWGRPMEEAQSRSTWYHAVHKDDRPLVRAALDAAQRGDSATAVFRVVRPDQTACWVRGRVFPVRNPANEVYRLVGVAEDITELRETEERFRQSQKMDAIGRLAGGVAHDFNNLLTVILSYSDLFMAEGESPEQQRDDMEAIRKAAESATALTRQLLISSRQEVFQPRVLHVNAMVESTGKMLERLIGEHIDLDLSLEASPDIVLGDQGRLEQVVVNLAVNARDAMPMGGRLRIETRNVTIAETFTEERTLHRAGTYVMLAVNDTGIGMDAETKARIFEPFFTTKEVGKGTGLGLSTVYGIIDQSGGFVTVDSEPGKGSTFKLYIPRIYEPAAESRESAALGESAHGAELILVVEDDAPIRRMVCDILERHGYRVLSAPDGATALEIASHRVDKIDLLLTDVVMPGMNGRLLAERFAKLRPHAKILFMSGYTSDAIVKAEILEAQVEYLAKPFTSAVLIAKVREVLDG